MCSNQFMRLKLFFSTFYLSLSLVIILGLGVANNCYADLTFHSTKEAPVVDPTGKHRFDRLIFPPNSGREVYIDRRPALQIGEAEIRSIVVRDAPRDPVLDKAMELAGRQRGREYPRLPTWEIIFRLQSSEAKKLNAFAKLHSGETFAVRFRGLLLSIPTFVGSAGLDGDGFALIGLTDTDIDQLKKLYPSLRDERKGQK